MDNDARVANAPKLTAQENPAKLNRLFMYYHYFFRNSFKSNAQTFNLT